jgi:Putative DNA-binding domain
MMSPRLPQRFRSILGDSVGDIGFGELERLKGCKESDDFEVKSALYKNGDADKRELAVDVASMANARGGILLIGATETSDVVEDLTPVVFFGEVLRIYQIVANWIVPPLSIHIHTIPNSPDDPERGYLLIVIPKSQLAPHAVPVNNDLRYFVRDGPGKRPMGESEVAQRYRTRFNDATSREQRVDKIHNIASLDLDVGRGAAWLILSSTPSDPGSLPLNKQTMDETSAWFDRVREQAPVPERLSRISQRFTTGVRRIIARDHREENQSELVYDGIVHLFNDGSVGLAARVSYEEQAPELAGKVPISDEELGWMLCNGLLLIGHHFDRCSAGGELTLMSSLVSDNRMQITKSRSGSPASEQTTNNIERLSRTVSTGDITKPGPALIATASHMHSELLQGFGWPESLQLTTDGNVNWRQVQDEKHHIKAWCEKYTIQVIGQS